MRLPRECYQMQQTIETHLPNLSQAQLAGLVLWVCGAILAGSACQNAVAAALSTQGKLVQPAPAPAGNGSTTVATGRGPCQTELDVSLCFAPLLRWVLSWWHSDRLAPGGGPHVEGERHHRHRHQRGLPGLRHSRGLAHPPRHPARVLDGPDSGTAAGTGSGGP